MHNPRIECSSINVFIMLINNQRGRGLTTTEANTLIQLARSL